VGRTPFYLESQGGPLFAWLHLPEAAAPSGHGVVVCPPVGHEQVHAHRGLRHLADALAGAGFPVLRFDLHGTGDSAGADEDPDRLATWLANVRDARGWLEQELGCTRVSLVGLRLGAALAARAAAERAVDGLLLWAPVVKGRSYVRELKALSLTAARGARPPAAAPEGIEAAGFVLTEQTAQELGRLDLLQCRPLCRRALVVSRDDGPGDAELHEHLKGLGIEAQHSAQPGYADMMAEPHYNKVPRAAIAHIVQWLAAGSHGRGRSGEEVVGEDALLLAATAGWALLSRAPLRERVLPISRQPHLVGVVSEPADAPPANLPTVVMLNAGSSYRVGPNRLYVTLARQLAARGFRCVRLDLCGLGDSVCPDAARENDPYPATAFRDIDLTLKYLRSHLGAERFVLLGLCSGAYAAFQSAAQLADPGLVESVLINPLTFFWREGMSLDASPALQLRSFQHYWASVWQPAKWLKVLSGRSKIGIAGAMRLLGQHWRLRGAPGNKGRAGGRTAAPDGPPSHPLQEDLPGDLERVVKAGRHLACFFARSDPGYGILTFYARRKVQELRRAGRLSLYFLDGADHTFSGRGPRRALAEALAEHLGRRYLPRAD
jgi:alpha-beta hydrolase superfamily lysophospholipase